MSQVNENNEIHFELFPYAVFSSGLASSDFACAQTPKKSPAGKGFGSNEEVIVISAENYLNDCSALEGN